MKSIHKFLKTSYTSKIAIGAILYKNIYQSLNQLSNSNVLELGRVKPAS